MSPGAAEPARMQLQEIARFDARFDRSGFPFTSLIFGPDGRVLALLTDPGDALLIETATGRELARPRQVVAVSPDRRWLVTRSEDGTGRLIEMAGGTEAMLIGPFSARAFSPDGRVLAVTDRNGTITRLIDTATRQEVGSAAHHYAIEVYVAEVSSYGSWSTDSSDELSPVVETPNGKVLVHLTTGISEADFSGRSRWGTSALSPDSRWRAGVGRNQATGAPLYNVTLLEVASGRLVTGTGCQSPPGPPRIAFSPDSSLLAVADSGMFASEFSPTCNRLIDTATGAERARFEGAMSIAFSPDSRWLATGGSAAQMIDTASGVLTRVEHDGRVDGVAFSPDGTLLATVSTAGTAPTLQSTVRLLRVNP
ncbi:MAG: WD40 repeat domain-containing protein [Nitrospira sp.]